jgi:DNA helicase-2/ATP-dependent DNA helicase PcrA
VTKSSLISAANPQQLEAITTTEGPLLIIAGPGSGKTFTLVERVVYLLTEKDIFPECIMVVTFTDKAAQELTTRISNRLDQLGVRFNLNEMYLGTFHSICLRWLQDHREFTRLKHNFTVFDEFDQHYFVYQRFSAFEALEGITHLAGNPATASTWERSESLMKWINTVSEEALDIQALLVAPDAAIQALGRCAQLYHTLLEEQNALDFSTIQREALHLLRTYPPVRDALKERIVYVMVDEYQDFSVIDQCKQTNPTDKVVLQSTNNG